MSEVYTRDQDCANETPACLINVTPKKEKPKSAPGPPPLKSQPPIELKQNKTKEVKPPVPKAKDAKPKLVVKPKEIKPKEIVKSKPPISSVKPPFRVSQKVEKKVPYVYTPPKRNIKAKITKKISPVVDGKKPPKPKTNKEEYELADDATSLNVVSTPVNSKDVICVEETELKEIKMGRICDLDPTTIITVNGKEELPCTNEIKNYQLHGNKYIAQECEEVQRVIAVETYVPVAETTKTIEINQNTATPTVTVPKAVEADLKALKLGEDDCNGNEGDDEGENPAPLGIMRRDIQGYCTLPRGRRGGPGGTRGPGGARGEGPMRPPRRTTPDGTDIYYWCDMPKKSANGKLDFAPR